MSGIALRQIRAVIAVCEEGSFTRAAARENSTQSGISQHVANPRRQADRDFSDCIMPGLADQYRADGANAS